MTILRIGDTCPTCNQGIMRATYEPYECRCDHCGYWWDQRTGKEVNPAIWTLTQWEAFDKWSGDDD